MQEITVGGDLYQVDKSYEDKLGVVLCFLSREDEAESPEVMILTPEGDWRFTGSSRLLAYEESISDDLIRLTEEPYLCYS